MGLLSQNARNWREGRRLRGYELSQQGWTQKVIDHALGFTEGAISHWMARARNEGSAALCKRSLLGAPLKSTKQQRAHLPMLLVQGAPAFGFVGDVWTAERVATVIMNEWQVTYHPSHVTKLLHVCGRSRQKPARRAR